MNRIGYRTLGYSAVLFALALSAGCATTGDVDGAKKMAQEAKQAADQANSTAMEAKNEAAAAKAAAEAAQRAAEEAKAAAQMTNEKIDRAFKKSVQK
jgi:hypothetical protein